MLLKSAFVTFFLVSICGFAVNANAVDRNDCKDPLSCYLQSIVIQIPDICQMVETKELCIKNFVCNGINLAAVPSDYEQPTTLQMGVEGLGTACQGDYSYGRLVSGSITASINQTNFDAGLLIGKSGELPVSTSFSSCDITSMNVHISFSSDALDYLSPKLAELIKKAFNVLLCTKVPEFLENNVTSALVSKVDPMLEYIISSQPTPLPIYNSHYTSWGNSLVSKVKNIVQRLEGVADLKDFILCLLQRADMQELKKTMITEVQNLFFTPLSTSDSSSASRTSGVEPEQVILVEEEPGAGFTDVAISPDTIIWHQSNFPAGYNSSLTLTSFKIRGLDSLNELELLEPVPGFNTTMRSAVGFGELTVTLGLQVDIVPMDSTVTSPKQKQDDALGARSTYTEKLQVTLAMENVSLLMDLVLAVNSFLLKSYYLDQLGSRSCWLSAVEELSIANLQVHTEITTLKAVQVLGSAGALEADILALVNNAIALVISPTGFGQLTTDLIAGLLQGPVRAQFNANAAAQLTLAKKASPCLSHYPYDDQTDFIVWAESSLVQTVDYVVNDLLGYQGVNKMMSCATNGTGQLALNTSKLAVSLGGLNSFYALRVLAPVVSSIQDAISLYELESLLSLGYCPFVGSPLCNPFQLIVAFNPQQAVKASANKLTNAFVQAASAFNLAVKLSNFSVYLNTELKLDKDGLRDTQYKQLSTLGCVGKSFQAIAVEQASLSVADAEINLNGEQSRNITRLVSKVLSVLTRQDKLDKRNSDMAYKLSVAEETCKANGVAPHVTPTDDDTSGGSSDNLNWQWELFILVVGCLSALIMLMAAYQYWGSYGKHYCSSEFLEGQTEEEEGMPLLTRLYHRWDCKNSLLFHHQIPLWIRIAVPLCVLGDVALFIQSNMDGKAVSVMAKIVTAAKTVDMGSVFDFGLGSTVSDMWEAGVYPLAALILFFSGAWPYVKLLSMLTAWLAPPAILSIERRESVLTVLDVLGKWSLIDFFVMILMLCAFYFNIYIGSRAVIEVTVLPRWGFYSFLLATMVSLGLGHIILACHRLIIEPKVLPIPDDYRPRESLSSIVYEMHLTDRDVAFYAQKDDDKNVIADESSNSESLLGTAAAAEEGDVTGNTDGRFTPVPTAKPDAALHAANGTTMLIKVTTAGKIAVVLALVVTALVVIAGTFVESMRFEFKGLVGLMLKDEAEVDYSFVTVGTSIPEHSGVPNDFATRWLQASLFLFGQAMPFAVLLAMLFLWVVPLTLASQRSLFVLAEVLNAWSALDVFCIAIAAALLEIQQFAAFIVGDSCDGINVILEEHMDEILEGDDKCFDVVAQLNNNSWLLFLAAALLIVVVLPLLQVCHNAIHLRLKLSAQAALLLHHLTRGSDKQAEALRDALRTASRDDRETRLSKEKLYGEDALRVRSFVNGGDTETTNELVTKLLPEHESPNSRTGTPFHSLSNAFTHSNTHSDSNTNTDSSGASTQPPAAAGGVADSNSEVPPPDRASTSSNPLNGSRSSARSSPSSVAAAAAEEEEESKEPTLWQRCTMHNFNMSLLQGLAAMNLVALSYTPTVVVEDSLVLSTTNSYALHAE